VAIAGEDGTTTGDVGRAMNYDSTNVHIALKALAGFGLVVKDAST
jgi:predicted transcriptional regulator